MPKLRRLDGADVIRILESFGFVLVRPRGSHRIMQRVVKGKTQTITVPVHGSQQLAIGTLHAIFRDVCRYILEDQVRRLFYTE